MTRRYIEDEDGAPYPAVFAVSRPDDVLYLPYAGASGTGSIEAAERIVGPNRHLGYKIVECQLVPVGEVDEDDDDLADIPLEERIRNGV